MDRQHLIMNGENLAEYAALAAEGLGISMNSGWGAFDDDNMVGANGVHGDDRARRRAARAGYGSNGERPGSTSTRYTEDAVGAVSGPCSSGASSTASLRKLDGRSAARGEQAEGRRPRVRAGLRGLLAPSGRAGRARRRHDRRQGRRDLARRRGARDREEPYPLSTPRPGWAEQDPEDWWRAAQACLARLPAGPRSASRARCTGSSCSTRTTACCGRRSSGTTSARAPSAPRSRRASASSA